MTSNIDRRAFLRQAGLAGTALVIGFYLPGCKKQDGPEPEGSITLFKGNVDDVPEGTGINPFVIIDDQGNITLMAHRPDMGQGTYQSMPLLIAEELDVTLDQVTIKQAPGDKKYGDQGVGGSASVRTMWEPMRKVGAAAREMLALAAATRWGIDRADCDTENGMVINRKTDERLAYADLVAAAAQLPIPENPPLKSPDKFRLIGKSVARPDVPLKVRGAANYGLDMKKEGMVYALIERAPSFSSKVKAIDDSAVLAIPGVQKVLKTERILFKKRMEGVAVIADSYWAALQGRRALKVTWENDEVLLDTAAIYDKLRAAAQKEGVEVSSEGAFARAYAAAPVRLEAEYETPFAAHAAMEPQNALVEVRADSCEIWAPTQFPQWAQQEVAKTLGFQPEQVTVHVAFLGGGFGRRALPDFILEGVVLSKELGVPVKVVWTREDDMTQSPFRPGSVNRLQGGISSDGQLVALQHKVTTPSISYSLFPGMSGSNGEGGEMEPVNEHLYDIPNYQSRYVFADVDPIPLVWWRSVYSSTNVFAHECFIDELAEAAGKDPVAFRMAMLQTNQRNRKFLQFLAEKANWEKPLPENWARGIAMTHCFNTTAGHVVEISRNSAGKIRIERIITAVDCGIAVNPDNVKAQCEGCVVMGLSAALKPAITFTNGAATENNFHTYPILRINEMPQLEVHVVPNEEAPTGSGEPALPPLAPALANAISRLTGKRIRKLPLEDGLMG
ncbi:MAG: xanthine dehydrogenase family protein molybdopterin-binding subunit [Lewinellaceae bacterium]|nr:xanthine dehydrogenase family protein molybdopterin-binding subunit [Lewinellaceae bacterium]